VFGAEGQWTRGVLQPVCNVRGIIQGQVTSSAVVKGILATLDLMRITAMRPCVLRTYYSPLPTCCHKLKKNQAMG